MKRILTIISILVFFTFCKKEETEICGCKDPKNELQWLNELIQKAETDTTGLYKGSIYLEMYNNEQMFYVMMPLEPVGHVIVPWFDCDGNQITLKPSDRRPQPKFNHLIYTNIE